MKTTTIRQFRAQVSDLLKGHEEVLVTRHGKPAGVLLPLNNPKGVPLEIRRRLYLELSAKIARQLDAKGITEGKLQRDFAEFKKRRRRQ